MHQRLLTWLLLSVILVVAGVCCWRCAENDAATQGRSQWSHFRHLSAPARHLTSFDTQRAPAVVPSPVRPESSRLEDISIPPLSATLRLTNTAAPLGQLVHNRHALLLANAWLDTSQLTHGASGRHPYSTADFPLPVPDDLRAQGEPGAYVVQSRALLDETFRELLAAAGATIISYMPNNAYLVRGSAATAQRLAADSRTQAVLSLSLIHI